MVRVVLCCARFGGYCWGYVFLAFPWRIITYLCMSHRVFVAKSWMGAIGNGSWGGVGFC